MSRCARAFPGLSGPSQSAPQKEARAAAEPRPRMGRSADMIKTLDGGVMIAARLERSPQEGLVDGRGTAIGVAANKVDVHRFEVGRRISTAAEYGAFEAIDMRGENGLRAVGIGFAQFLCPLPVGRNGELA